MNSTLEFMFTKSYYIKSKEKIKDYSQIAIIWRIVK